VPLTWLSGESIFFQTKETLANGYLRKVSEQEN
jgi:hypothetical protein